MGLDIEICKNVRLPKPGELEKYGESYYWPENSDDPADLRWETRYPEVDGVNIVRIYDHKDFPHHHAPYEVGAHYLCDFHGRFRAGSYGIYNQWRRWLASVGGWEPRPVRNPFGPGLELNPCAGPWAGEPGPFAELINFSDCEGIIGPTFAGKLLLDFERFDEAARPGGGYSYDLYVSFREGFRTAAEQNGLVRFC